MFLMGIGPHPVHFLSPANLTAIAGAGAVEGGVAKRGPYKKSAA